MKKGSLNTTDDILEKLRGKLWEKNISYFADIHRKN